MSSCAKSIVKSVWPRGFVLKLLLSLFTSGFPLKYKNHCPRNTYLSSIHMHIHALIIFDLHSRNLVIQLCMPTEANP